jgi:O-acetyl-ADP-ribose deacetylase (regulator of RNase III)
MREKHGDIWNSGADVIVVTTNGHVTERGECVMGRGIALEAHGRYPHIPEKLGALIRQHGNRVFNLGRTPDGFFLVSFPVKHHWREQADPNLIVRSARQLALMADAHRWKRIAVPRPGCGNGRLSWEDCVRPRLENIFDDRFTVYTFQEE